MGKRTIVNVMLLTLTIFSLGLTWFIAPSAIPATANTNVLYVKGESVLNENPNLEKNLKTHAKNWQLMAKVPVVGSLAKDKLDELTQGVTKGVYPY